MNRLTERYKIARLIARKVSGTISEEEADELDAWVELSARHREEVTRIEGRLREDIFMPILMPFSSYLKKAT